jgi:hypothetical protein
MPIQQQQMYLGDTAVNFYYLGDTQVGLNPISVEPFSNKNGLIAYFNAGNLTSYPTSGSIWYDISGKGLQAKPVSGSTFPTWDAANKTFVFNGTSDALSATFTTSSLIAQTQIVWLKLATNTPSGTGIGNIGSAPDQAGPIPEIVAFDGLAYDEGNDQKFRAGSSNGLRTVIATSTTTNTSEYFMVSSTRASGSNAAVNLYINNTSSGSGNFTPYDYSGPLQIVIGNRLLNEPNWAADGYFSGSISSYLVYNRVLPQAEITELYNLGPNLNDV